MLYFSEYKGISYSMLEIILFINQLKRILESEKKDATVLQFLIGKAHLLDNFIANESDLLNFAFDDIAPLQELWWLGEASNSGRSARQDRIARQQSDKP